MYRIIKSVTRLTRLDTSIITALVIFFPIAHAYRDSAYAFCYALPILIISMCGFVLNDLNDIESDRVNHPDRPLPSQSLSTLFAVILYYFLLLSSLLYVKVFLSNGIAFLYLLFILGFVNYSYVIDFTPYLKNIYVAIISIIPFTILIAILPEKNPIYILAVTFFLFIFGREMLMDIEDVKGDKKSLITLLPPKKAYKVAFYVQFFGILILIFVIEDLIGVYIYIFLILCQVIFFKLWSEVKKNRLLISAMKIQISAGLYYMI